MTAKQNQGGKAPDSSSYGTITDGVGTLNTTVAIHTGAAKQTQGVYAPDHSRYFTLTDGAGNLK